MCLHNKVLDRTALTLCHLAGRYLYIVRIVNSEKEDLKKIRMIKMRYGIGLDIGFQII
jgi:hypothetical protein